jgi:CNT family concentrative nucleoside transporter
MPRQPSSLRKILIPETEEVGRVVKVNRQEIGRNPIDALANGTTQGLQLALNVAAMLISFYALILLINYFLSFIGGISVNSETNLNQWISSATDSRFVELSLQAVFGFIFCTYCLVDRCSLRTKFLRSAS